MKKKKGKTFYEKKVMLGRDENGTPIRKSITGRTLAELNQRIEDAKQKWMEMNTCDNGVLFSTYANRWLTNTKAVRSINTKRMYRETLDRHIIPEIGNLYFSEICLADLQKIINDRVDKYETCNKIRLTLRQIYNYAADENIHNDVAVKKLVIPPKPKREKRALTSDETEAVLTSTLPDEARIFVKLLYYTGIRREEALALEVCDLDFDNSSLQINKVIVFDENTPVLKLTAKSAAGNRKVPIPTEFKDELMGYAGHCERILFPQQRNPGAYISKSSYVKFWKGITSGLSEKVPSAKNLTAHIFRHNYATLLYYSNVTLKMAAKLLGQEGTQMIMEVYAHLDEEREKVIHKVDAMFKMNQKTPQPKPEHFSE